MNSALVFTATWVDDDGAPAVHASCESALAGQVAPGWRLDRWVRTDNRYRLGDLRNVGDHYRAAFDRVLAAGYDALVTVEHDIQLPDPGALGRLLAVEAGAVFGVYLLRGSSPVANALQWIGGQGIGESMSVRGGLPADGSVVRCSGVGWGATVIRRSVVESIPLHDSGGTNPALDVGLARDLVRSDVLCMAHFGVMCRHWDVSRGRWLDAEVSSMGVRIIALQSVTIPGGERLTAGRFYNVAEAVASDLVRAGYASYAPAEASAVEDATARPQKRRRRSSQ